MIENLLKLRSILFRRMLRTIKIAQTGHLGACCSSLDLLLVLYFGDILRFDSENPRHPLRDYVLLRGHLGPLRYSIFNLLGWVSDEEMGTYRRFGSRLHGHEDMNVVPGVDITPSGSLGMLLSYAVGARIGFGDANMQNRIFCFLGDGEEEEGNVSEAARHAAHLKLKNLICVIDKNGGQLSTRVKNTDSSDLVALWSGYGWQTVTIENGHDIQEISDAYREAIALSENGPVCIIANTEKAHGIPGAKEDYCGFHVVHGAEKGDTVRSIEFDSVLDSFDDAEIPVIERKRLPERPEINIAYPIPTVTATKEDSENILQYKIEEDIVRMLAEKLGDRLYVLTSDYPPRTFVYGTGYFSAGESHYHNVGIREQHMTAMAHGIRCVRKDAVIVILCGDAFLYRHMDQMNMLAQAKTPVIFLSVQGGLSGGKNGSTHQSSGQPGALLTMPGMATEEPSSIEQFLRSVNNALLRRGPTYIRLHKSEVPWNFGGVHENGFERVNHSPDNIGTIVTCGMIAKEAFDAVTLLKNEGIEFTLLSVTSLSDCDGIAQWIPEEKPLVLLYNGNPKIMEGVVASEMMKSRRRFPEKIISRGFEFGTTGSFDKLLSHFRMDANSIVSACKKIIA